MTDASRKRLIEPRTLRGFRDILPAEALLKQKMLSTLRSVFSSFGFAPIETPHLEYLETLVGDSGTEIQKQIFRWQDAGGRDVALRFDLTIPFARFVSQYKNDLGIPFKRWAIGEVFRGERPQKGRYREFTQCDFDIVGTSSPGADAEVLQVIYATLSALNVPPFTIYVNNRRVMNALLDHLACADKASAVLIAVDKLTKEGSEAVRAMLTGDVGLAPSTADEILRFVDTSKGVDATTALGRVREQYRDSPQLGSGIDELSEVIVIARGAGIPEQQLVVDFGVARGLGYYTGCVYETIINELPSLGSVCSGGRYDNLTQSFQREELPGVGASVGLDRLLAAFEELGRFNQSSTPAKLLVTTGEGTRLPLAHRTAANIRAHGVAVEVYPDTSKIEKQIKYARRKGFSFILTFPRLNAGGSEEAAEITLEALASGERRVFPLNAAGLASLAGVLNGVT